MKAWKLNKKPRPDITKKGNNAYVANRQCYRKVRFPDDSIAHLRVNEIVDEGGPQLYVYECGNCNGFHLTKNKAVEGQRIELPII